MLVRVATTPVHGQDIADIYFRLCPHIQIATPSDHQRFHLSQPSFDERRGWWGPLVHRDSGSGFVDSELGLQIRPVRGLALRGEVRVLERERWVGGLILSPALASGMRKMLEWRLGIQGKKKCGRASLCAASDTRTILGWRLGIRGLIRCGQACLCAASGMRTVLRPQRKETIRHYSGALGKREYCYSTERSIKLEDEIVI